MAGRLVALAALAVAGACAADPERVSLMVTIRWDEAGASVEKVERRELAVPMQRGFPQLWRRFFELRDADDNVHYAGPLVDTRGAQPGADGKPAASTFRVLVPDLPEARRLVIVERVPANDVDKARRVVKDETLQPR